MASKPLNDLYRLSSKRDFTNEMVDLARRLSSEYPHLNVNEMSPTLFSGAKVDTTSFPGSSWSWPRRGEKTLVKYVEHSKILGILSHAHFFSEFYNFFSSASKHTVNINTVDSDYPVEFIFQIITNLIHLNFCTYF